jgi:HEPN domain-containing protein/RNA polymerase subunit RPABC4/transcription elongation factor Spt4
MVAYVKWVRVLEPKYYCRNCESQIASTDKTCPKCGKNLEECGRRIEVTIVENIAISDSLETLVIDPIGQVERALKERDYFKATVLLASVIEFYGKRAIIGKLGAKVNTDDIYRLHLSEVTLFLYGLGMIDQPCYSALIELNKQRNRYLHVRNFDVFRRKSGGEAEAAIRKAMRCIKVLIKSSTT